MLYLAASAERPSSACSVRGSTRQRLQHPSTRRVHASEYSNHITSIDVKPQNSHISEKSLVDDNQDKQNTQQDIPSITPLKNVIFKKINRGPLEVRL